MRIPLPLDQLPHRRPVWDAISQLWVDTELQPDDYVAIAKTLRESDYSWEELDAIYRYELAPLLFCSIYIWPAFDLNHLEKKILERSQSRFWKIMDRFFPWTYSIWTRGSEKQWKKVLDLITTKKRRDTNP